MEIKLHLRAILGYLLPLYSSIATNATGGYSYNQIGDYFGIHISAVGKMVWYAT